MRSAIVVVLLISFFATCCVGCQVGETKPTMAVVSAREVLTKCNAGIKAAEEVRQQFAPRQDDLKKQEAAIATLRADPTLADPKTGKQAELEKLARQYVADSQSLRKDVSAQEAIVFEPIVNKVNKVLAQYAKEHGLFSIQDKNGFAYIDPSIDITEAIIKKVDEVK